MPANLEIDNRLKPLMNELRPDARSCPLVVEGNAAKRVTFSHYSAGADATYVQICRRPHDKSPLSNLSATIGYAPFVESTTIVYDLTDETMQGKARPFVCQLDQQLSRAYLLLPYQVEQIDAHSSAAGEARQFAVAFLDARGETIRAALPFELRLVTAGGDAILSEYYATDGQGRWSQAMKLTSMAGKLIIRSLLTGREASLSL